jgi:lipid II:glycine glycyltransferase (peptidoglycan interpeptide bridge formation enzyme)
MIETCKRRNTRPIFSDIKYFYSVWDSFSPKGWVMIHLAEVNDKPICAAFCFCFGNTFRYDLWGWNGQYANQKISETFQWKNILYAKNMGFKYYDFVQIDPIVANAIKSVAQVSDKIKSRELYGATEFKLRYGGDAVIYPGFFTCFANEFYRFLVVALFKTKRLFS